MNGMDDNDDEHNFSDDDFADLPDSTLCQLEQNALTSTQYAVQPQPAPRPQPQNAANYKPNSLHQQSNTASVTSLPAGRQLPWNQSEVQILEDDFEFEEDNNVRTPVQEPTSFLPAPRMADEMVQREQWRLQRFAPGQGSLKQPRAQHWQHPPIANLSAKLILSNIPHREQSNTPDSMLLDGADAVQSTTSEQLALRAQIQRLLQEKAESQATIQEQKGEIAVVRTNYEKDSTTHQRQLSALSKSMQEKDLKHQAALQAKTEELQRLVTETKFYKHELEQEAEKSKSLQSRLKEKTLHDRTDALLRTPRKGPAESLRDGFEDDEIMLASPVHSGKRSKPVTPTAIGKRKRKPDVPSPIRPLVLRQSGIQDGDPMPPPTAPEKVTNKTVVTIRRDVKAERNLQLLQQILQYRLRKGGKRMIEVLSKYSFPSDQEQSISSIVLDRTAMLNKSTFQTELLLVFIEILDQVLTERYYQPFSLLIEIIEHIVNRNLLVIEKTVIVRILPILEQAARINAAKRFEHSPVNRATFGNFRQTPREVLNHDVSGTLCLDLMHTIARACVDDAELIGTFWSTIETDTILMMLNAWQPLTDITLMLHLLSTSVLGNTFGKICSTQEEQSKFEHHTITRVCYLLWENLRVDEGLIPYTRTEICRFRLETINLLTQLAFGASVHPHDDPNHRGSILLAEHPSAIARIVRSIYDEADAMYNLNPSYELHADLVNRGVRLLYHIMHTHGSGMDLQKKLSAVNGGVHKHRIVLTRLAFSQGLYVDRLITNETIEMATSMLEDSVTPDEADQLVQAFPHVMSGHGRRLTQEDKQ